MDVTMHKVLPEDARAYTACHIACWQAAYKGIISDEYLANMPSEIDARTERLIKGLNESTEYRYYYAAVDGAMIGRLIVGKSRDEDRPDAGEICALYLLKEYWGKGCGRQLMEYAIEKLGRMGHREVILWVLEENKRARRFYEKCGFAFDGTKKEIEIGKRLVEIRYALALR